MSTTIKEQEETSIIEQKTHQHKIILYNDDFNTFDFVIQALIEVCEHEPRQAEQCTMLVHYRGKCEIKSGEWNDLEPRCLELLSRGLSAELT